MRLGDLIRCWRRLREITIRDAAKQIGVPISTLSRVENGEGCDGETLRKLLAWAMGSD